MQEYGTVISTIEGPSTRKFSFTINKGVIVKRGQFIQLKTEEGSLIGRVSDIYKTNRYFMRPESVTEYEKSGRKMDEIFPVGDWEYLVADVRSLGIYKTEANPPFVDSLFPPSPGTRVSEPDTQILAKFFGLDNNGLHIGSLNQHDLEVRLNPTKLLQKHLAILAISGAGKSFLTSVLVEEILKRNPEQGQLAVIIIDTHGEYTSFADDPEFSPKTKVFTINDIRIGTPNLSAYNIADYIPNMSFVQMRELSKIIREMKGAYSLTDLMNSIETRDDLKSATKDPLLSLLAELASLGIFGAADYPNLEDLARQGGVSILDVSNTANLKKKQIIVAYIAKKLFNARRNGIIPPFILIVEEAHQFAPEQAKSEAALSRGIITTIAREGRKFNSSLCLISQRPIQLSTTALSQCNTHIILKVTNPYDLDHIGKSSEGITSDVQRQISSLRVGNAIVVGEAVNFPLFVKIRNRMSKPSSKGLPLEEAAREYHRIMNQKKKDAKEFM